MGLVPMIGSWRDRAEPFLVMRAEPTSPAAEAYRSLRTSLQFAAYENVVGSVLVTSPTATEGKTSTVSNLGVVLATVGKNVVLVSADLRRPRLAAFFGLDEGVGLTSVMIGELTLDQALQPVPDIPGLTVLGCGPVPPNPAELLSSPKFAEIFDELTKRFDLVLVGQLTPVARHRSCAPVPIDRYDPADRGGRDDHEATTPAGGRAAGPSRCPAHRDRAERGHAWRGGRLRLRVFVHVRDIKHTLSHGLVQWPLRVSDHLRPALRQGALVDIRRGASTTIFEGERVDDRCPRQKGRERFLLKNDEGIATHAPLDALAPGVRSWPPTHGKLVISPETAQRKSWIRRS